jgi:hypothetical protein
VSPPAERGLPVLALCRLLIGLRLRLLRNRLRRGSQVGTARLAACFGLLVPVTYVGLFLSALQVIGKHGGQVAESGALVLVVSAIVLASTALKLSAAEAVTGAGGENEFLVARPVSLPALVVARGLSGVATDLYDALFLFPVLAAAAFAWDLGAGALAVAAASSVCVQVTVSACTQAGQIALVRLVPPARRRLASTVCALISALAMALLWMAGSTVLRAPASAARALTAHAEWLRLLPGAPIAAPLQALRAGNPSAAALSLAVLVGAAAAALAAADRVARLCTRRGWEQAEAPWLASGAGRPGRRPLGLFLKDWRLLTRDRARLITFLGLPALFVGVQVFGSAGWDWLAADATRLALVAYSLAAYAATFGPLQHMTAERRAFWLLRMAPLSLGRLLVVKAAFWALVVSGLVLVVYALLALVSGAPLDAAALTSALLAIGGAAGMSFLAVGLAAAVADLSDDTRPAVGLGTTYLFMLVAGLYNIVLLSPGLPRWRALLLYAVAAGASWVTGVRRAATLFDPEEARRRLLSPAAGALALVLLFLGERTTRALAQVLDPAAAPFAALPLIALVGVGAALHRLRRRPDDHPRPLGASLLIAAALGLGGALTAGTARAVLPPLLLVRPLVEELAARGLLQAGLQRNGDGPVRRAAILLTAAVAVWAVSPAPGSAIAVSTAVAPALAMAATGRLGAALLTRGLIEMFPLAAAFLATDGAK